MPDTKTKSVFPAGLSREAFLDLLQEGTLLIDESGNILHANNTIGKLLEVDPGDLPGYALSDFFDGETIKLFGRPERPDPDYDKIVKSCLIKTASGKQLHIILTVAQYWDTKDIYYCIVFITDVTVFKRTEKDLSKLASKQASLLELGAGHLLRADEAVEFSFQAAKFRDSLLRQTEEGYRALFMAGPIPTFAWKYEQGNFHLINMNQAATNLILCRNQECQGTPASEFFHDTPQILENMKRCFNERRIVTRELEYHGFNSENYSFLWHFTFVPPDQVLLYTQDIQHHKAKEMALDKISQESKTLAKESREKLNIALEELESEKALRVRTDDKLQEQQTFLREVIDLDPNLIYVCDWNGRYIMANQAMSLFLGQTLDRIIGRRQIDVAPWLGDDKLQENRMVMTTLKDKVLEECLEDSEGRRRWFITYKRPLVAPDGLDQRILIVSVDITKEKHTWELLLKERDNLKRTMETSPDGILVLTRDMRVQFANEQAVKLLGLPENWKSSNHPLKELSQTGAIDLDALPISTVLRKGATLRGEKLNITRRSEKLCLSMNIAPLPGMEGDTEKVILTLQDITRQKKSEEKIKLLSLAMDQSPASVIITNPEGIIEYVNSRFMEISGYTAPEVIGKSPSMFLAGRHSDEFFSDIHKILLTGREWRGEICNLTKSGDEFWVLSSISPIFGDEYEVRHFVAVEEDITQKRLQEDKLRHLAVHDGLTGLANRLLLMDRLQVAIARADRMKNLVALIFLDLNDFKEINDTLGHEAGDHLLKDVAHRISGCLRNMDTAARFGGDEFVVLIPDVHSKEDVVVIAERLLENLLLPYSVANKQRTIGASLGISLYPADGQIPDVLIRKADMAMYAAKEMGVNKYAFSEAPDPTIEGIKPKPE